MAAEGTDLRECLRREIEDTRRPFHRQLGSIPDAAISLPSGNPAWTIGQVLHHMSLAPRFMSVGRPDDRGRRWINRLVPRLFPKRLFDGLKARLTRLGTGYPSRQFLAAEYDRAGAAILRVLESLSGEDCGKHMPYPDWDPLLRGEAPREYLFGYIKRYFDSHAAQTGRALQSRRGEPE
jgi:hypothetical protein